MSIVQYLFNVVYNVFTVLTPGTTAVVTGQLKQRAQNALLSSCATLVSLCGAGLSITLPSMALFQAGVNLGVDGAVQITSAYTTLRGQLYQKALPTLVSVFGQKTVQLLERADVVTEAAVVAAVIALGTELSLQVLTGETYFLRKTEQVNLANPTMVSNLSSFREKYGGLAQIFIDMNPFAHLIRLMYSSSVLDGLAMFALQNITQVCLAVPNQVYSSACSRAIDTVTRLKTAYITLASIASIAPQVGRVVPLGKGVETYGGSCDFLRQAVGPQGLTVKENLTKLSEDESKEQLTAPLLATVAPEVKKIIIQNPDLALTLRSDNAADFGLSQVREDFDKLVKNNPSLYRYLFRNERDYNLFQLMVLGLFHNNDQLSKVALSGETTWFERLPWRQLGADAAKSAKELILQTAKALKQVSKTSR